MPMDDLMPKMLFGEELKKAMTYLPQYDDNIRKMDAGTRLLRLNDLYNVFLTTEMSAEIYHKLYMMTLNSLEKKGSKDMIRQLNANHMGNPGVITGMTSSTIIAPSGIGKTSAIEKSIRLFNETIIMGDNPYHKICPVIVVTCPFDANYKGLLISILQELDEQLGTDYFQKAQKSTMNAQRLMALICQTCMLHVGLLIIDEIQFLAEHNSGSQLLRMILQLVNSSGVNVLMVGTPECIPFFQKVPQIARRSVGLEYESLGFNDDFKNICTTLFGFQYVQNPSPLSASVLCWLYDHSGGVMATLVALIHDAQEIAIFSGDEQLNIKTLDMAYEKRMKMLHTYISPSILKASPSISRKKKGKVFPEVGVVTDDSISIENIIRNAKELKRDVIKELENIINIVEVILC